MARARPPVWLLLAAAAYVAYFALVITCHVFRPGPAAAPALDRVALDAYNLTRPLQPASFDLARDGVLYGVRAVQLITLLLGMLVAFRRPHDPVALLGAWVLATAGVFSVALPSGWAAAWQALPVAAGVLLWFPFLSSVAAGGVFFAFVARFTRAHLALPRPALYAVAATIAAGVLPYAAHRMSIVYGWDIGTPWAPGRPLRLIAANIIPAGIGLALLLQHYRQAADVIEKRRTGVLLAGGALGAAAGVGVTLAASAIGPQPGRSLFASWTLSLGTLLFLVFPLSFAYAILRYRLFDLGVAARLGLRYALARRALLSIVPIAVAALVFDVWSHGDRPLGEILSARRGMYVLVAGAALILHVTRDRWLDRLDRTFFRERYDARRILIDLVTELRASCSFDELATLAARKIQQALQPKFLVIGARDRAGAEYHSAAVLRPEKAPGLPPPVSVLMDVARVLKQPMDVAPDSSGWLASRLPAAELQYLRRGRVELVVPIAAAGHEGDAVLLLGPKRSEEPYSDEDRELLGAIGDALSLSLANREIRAGDLDVDLPRVIGGRYRLERLVGRGGMGVVYEARDLRLDRRVAVKLMREELVDSVEARGRFEREARAAAGFTHPNVVTIFDFAAPDAGSAMIVMELLEGRTLRDELTDGPLPAARVAGIMRALSDAVDAAHAQGLLHRDLKPENILLAGDGPDARVKIVDFGIARPLDAGSESLDRLTRDGALVGTPRYMAPEQLAGGPPAPSWDIWALAVIAFEMLTGAHPFGERRHGLNIPPPLERFFARALSAQAADRFSTARALSAAMEAAAGAAGV